MNDSATHKIAVVAFERLIKEGFSEQLALRLSKEFPEDQVLKQCDWLDKRNPSKNRLGMLRKAIEENWDKPISDKGKGHSNSPQRPPLVKSRKVLPLPQREKREEKILALLLEKTESLKSNSPTLFDEFLVSEAAGRRKIKAMPIVGETLIATILASYDSAESSLKRLKKFLGGGQPKAKNDRA